jgi:hypothetical protein
MVYKAILVLVMATLTAACAPSSQTYWYCWDQGTPAPHHLGYYVPDDHYCSDVELRDAGVKP